MTTVRAWLVRSYVPLLLALWVFIPEVRRIADWHSGFHAISILSAVPLVALVPGLFFVRRNWSSVGTTYRLVAIVWCIGFAYAFFIALFSGGMLAGAYEAALFVGPMLLGYALVPIAERDPEFYERIATWSLILAALTSIYGIYQYVAPPEWDVFWADGANIASIGNVEPYGFRIWGTLNAPAPLATWLLFAIVLNLPRFRPGSLWRIALVAPCLVALFLTSVRTAWIGLALALVIYVVLSPRRGAFLATAALVVAVAVGLSAALVASNAGGTLAIQTITDRIATFGDLSNDDSANTRNKETVDALHLGTSEPLGQGLGSIGTSAKLGGEGATIVLDSGYLSRFDEMGVLGFAAYVLALGIAVVGTTLAYRRALATGEDARAAILAAAVAVQFTLLALDVSSDTHSALPGIFFWLTLFLGSRAHPGVAPLAPDPHAVRRSLRAPRITFRPSA